MAEQGIAFIEFTLLGTLAGKPIRLRAVDRMLLDGDKLVMRESYYDPSRFWSHRSPLHEPGRTFRLLMLPRLRLRLRRIPRHPRLLSNTAASEALTYRSG